MGWPPTLSLRHRCSVFHAHTDHDEHRIVLFRTALDRRHRAPWCNGKCCLVYVGRRAGATHRRRGIARGPSSFSMGIENK